MRLVPLPLEVSLILSMAAAMDHKCEILTHANGPSTVGVRIALSLYPSLSFPFIFSILLLSPVRLDAFVLPGLF